MRLTLIACAAAGALACGAASASDAMHPDRTASPSFVRVQYGVPPHAGPGDRRDDRALSVNEREQQLKTRIHRGLDDGRITYREGRALLRQLSGIESKERAYLADGRLNRWENDNLHRELDRLALNVRTQLRDDDRRS